MNRQQILTTGLILTIGVCAALGATDYHLSQEIQELEESLGLYQEGAYPLGVDIEKVEGADVESADSDKSDESEATGSLSEI
jgi:hypothetical protein